MFKTYDEAYGWALKMSKKYRCTWYIIKWTDGYHRGKFEAIGPDDMYYSKLASATKIKAQEA